MCGKYLVKFCCFVVTELRSRHLTKKPRALHQAFRPPVQLIRSSSRRAQSIPSSLNSSLTGPSQDPHRRPGRRRRPEPASERGDPPNSPGRRTVGEVPVRGGSTPKRPFPIARPLLGRGVESCGRGSPCGSPSLSHVCMPMERQWWAFGELSQPIAASAFLEVGAPSATSLCTSIPNRTEIQKFWPAPTPATIISLARRRLHHLALTYL